MRRLSVASAEGFELSGAFGPCRLAWRNGGLWAERFGNASVSPPLPWLALDRTDRTWKGELRTAFGLESAAAKLSHKVEKLESRGRRYEALRTELTLERPIGATTITTWFVEGLGILRQEQRTRGVLDLRLEWLSGPRPARSG